VSGEIEESKMSEFTLNRNLLEEIDLVGRLVKEFLGNSTLDDLVSKLEVFEKKIIAIMNEKVYKSQNSEELHNITQDHIKLFDLFVDVSDFLINSDDDISVL
jgi:sulfur carrier protein ThiS